MVSAVTTLRTFTNHAEAGICVSYLQAQGFDAVLLDEGSFAWAGATIPFRLQVPEEQAEAAVACLATARSQKTDPEANADATPTI
jgi:hypothetical protein